MISETYLLVYKSRGVLPAVAGCVFARRVNEEARSWLRGGLVTTAHTSTDPALSATVYIVLSRPTTTSECRENQSTLSTHKTRPKCLTILYYVLLQGVYKNSLSLSVINTSVS